MVSLPFLVRATLILLGGAAVGLDERRPRARRSAAWTLLAALAVGELGFVLVLWLRHRGFPLHLEIMEGAVLQHVERLARGEALYPAPSADFVPFAYNPLHYVMCVPLVRLFGASVSILRALSIAGALVAAWLVFAAVTRRSGSRMRGLVAMGLFAAAYEAMDAYLDTAHGDSWLLCAILGGTWSIHAAVGRSRSAMSESRAALGRLLGVALLCAGFWLKQPGAIFAVGGVAYLVARRGVCGALPELALAAVAGPLAYGLAGPPLFGPLMHFYTWTVPRAWSTVDAGTLLRVAEYLARFLPLLAGVVAVSLGRALRRGIATLDVWQVQASAALASALLAALDAGGNDNVFIPLVTFTIVVGVSELPRMVGAWPPRWRRAVEPLALVVSFAALLYDPRHVWTPSSAFAAHAELVALVSSLPGPVFAPDLGPTDGVMRFTPPLTWVAIEDLVRGPRGGAVDPAAVRALLGTVYEPCGPAFILASRPLERRATLGPLLDRYVLDADFGERFAALRTQPMRCGRLYPRYLYRYVGRSIPAERNHA